MREDQKIKQHGKDYVLFAGLVAEAHAKFVGFSLTAELDPTSTEDKPRVFAHFKGTYLGEEGVGYMIESTGIGTGGRQTDRSGAAADAPIEMAETRAKARALRVAVNIGEAAAEELPEDERMSNRADSIGTAWAEANQVAAKEVEEAATLIKRGQAARANPPSAAKKKTHASESLVKPETLRQVRFLADTFAEARGDDEEEHWTSFIDNLGYPPEEMTEGEAQKWISRYQKGLKKLENEGEEDGGA